MIDDFSMVYADKQGNVYDYPGCKPLFRSGNKFVEVNESDLIKLPYGSYLFTMPDRYPVAGLGGNHSPVNKSPDGEEINAVASFPASAYLRTYLPAFKAKKNAVTLPLWAYTGVVLRGDDFYIPAVRIDSDVRSDPVMHENHDEFKKAVNDVSRQYRDNRLVKQLSVCSGEYNCLCARNFFLSRFEAPVPTSPACNADCIGCLSFQDGNSGFCSSQFRLEFSPSVDEISQVILHHFKRVKQGVASFGQGCEGEPLLRGTDLVKAVSAVRANTSDGTININTNGSRPEIVSEMIKAGLDSIRVSLNSPTEKYYMSYHKPVNYTFNDVLRTIDTALNAGIFVSINLFFMPGFTDAESEVDSLFTFLKQFPVNMIQTRNMNIDPDYFFEGINFQFENSLGIANLINNLRESFPGVRLGYYNPSIK
jgi:wyosine [tRNA(Phe)-imidazoG37] synthetase (radical SAM superfamily)